MKTEEVQLDISGIFERKGIKYEDFDIAMMRYMCKKYVEYLLDTQKQRDRNGIH